MKIKVDSATLREMPSRVEELKDIINDAYEKAKLVVTEIETEGEWEGESQKVMLSFMDLCLAYHRLFIKEDTPLDMAKKAFNELISNIDSYYTVSPSYKYLKEDI